jgi:hypothetical protein
MKRLLAFLTAFVAVGSTTVVSTPEASARIAAARVSIPFDFSANHQVLPAGCYRVELQSHSYVILVDCTTGKVAGMLVSTTTNRKTGNSSAVFQKVGKSMRLTQLNFASLQTQLAVQPKPEREIAGIRQVAIEMN